jgi:hypothetical protein
MRNLHSYTNNVAMQHKNADLAIFIARLDYFDMFVAIPIDRQKYVHR